MVSARGRYSRIVANASISKYGMALTRLCVQGEKVIRLYSTACNIDLKMGDR